MSNNTSIEWTDATWNPVTGCSKVSAGCKNCYAEAIADRFWAGSRKFTDVMCHEDRLMEPLKWKKPRRVFVNSMSDLFHEDVPDEFIDKIFAVMALADKHKFQILTKRPSRMQSYVVGLVSRPPSNVWLGVSVEDQATADERIPLLIETPAAVRFVSYEPALGPVDFSKVPGQSRVVARIPDWIIVGGESGANARPCKVEWIRKAVTQCAAAGVACFVKQDSGIRPGMQGRIPNELWIKEFPALKEESKC